MQMNFVGLNSEWHYITDVRFSLFRFWCHVLYMWHWLYKLFHDCGLYRGHRPIRTIVLQTRAKD